MHAACTCNAARWHARLSKQFGATAGVEQIYTQLTCIHSIPQRLVAAHACAIDTALILRKLELELS